MKKLLFSIALAAVAPVVWGQTSSTTTTTTTTGGGTITEFTPGSAIVLKESSGPRHYRYGEKVVYVTRGGRVLDEDMVRTRIKVGIPVHVQFTAKATTWSLTESYWTRIDQQLGVIYSILTEMGTATVVMLAAGSS
jgi:hypothetical protein